MRIESEITLPISCRHAAIVFISMCIRSSPENSRCYILTSNFPEKKVNAKKSIKYSAFIPIQVMIDDIISDTMSVYIRLVVIQMILS